MDILETGLRLPGGGDKQLMNVGVCLCEKHRLYHCTSDASLPLFHSLAFGLARDGVCLSCLSILGLPQVTAGLAGVRRVRGQGVLVSLHSSWALYSDLALALNGHWSHQESLGVESHRVSVTTIQP